MSSSTPDTFTAAVLTISDSSSRGERADLSGPALAKSLEEYKFQVVATQVVPDDRTHIENALIQLAEKAQLVVSTGGTGVAERDVTPEATRAVCERLVEGVVERMRFEGAKKTPLAVLSRGVCGLRGKSMILNVPGSPKGAVESLEAVIDILPHALKLLAGETQHT
jgi:molybdenum cofactor synthesis domain-containing protein